MSHINSELRHRDMIEISILLLLLLLLLLGLIVYT